MHKIIRQEEQIKATWSGGTTTQLYISPSEAVYGERNFDFRISTATIDVEESEFSDLTGYTRYLLSLKNPLVLLEGNNPPYLLEPLTCYTFDGGSKMKSLGQTQDFNVMVRPYLKAEVKAVNLKKSDEIRLAPGLIALYCINGPLGVTMEKECYDLMPGDFIFMEAESVVLTTMASALLIQVSLH